MCLIKVISTLCRAVALYTEFDTFGLSHFFLPPIVKM